MHTIKSTNWIIMIWQMINKTLILLLLLSCLFACQNKSQRNNKMRLNVDSIGREERFEKKIRHLVKDNKSVIAKNFVDSMLNVGGDKGFFYYEKGYLQGLEFLCDSAIINFKKAERLNYN